MSEISFKKYSSFRGYFHKGDMRLRVPILSVAAGKLLMERSPKTFEGQEAELEKQLVDAGLPETRGDREDVRLIQEYLDNISIINEIFSRAIGAAIADMKSRGETGRRGVLIITIGNQPSLN